jgi:hypothetical protein
MLVTSLGRPGDRRCCDGGLAAGVAALSLGLSVALGAGCAGQSGEVRTRGGPPRGTHAAQEEFWRALESLCGLAFEGRVVEDSTGNPDFAGRPLVMHVRRCESGGRILVPFHVGEDRSRTWVFTRTAEGVRLKHDHRHRDGSEDEITQYGGDTRSPGTAERQEFHADAATATLIPAAAANVWTVEIVPGRVFSYGLRREGTERRFRAEFDLGRPAPVPPAPWGHE